MFGVNWHQVVDETAAPLADGLGLPETKGFRRVLVSAALENTANVALVFDAEIYRWNKQYYLDPPKKRAKPLEPVVLGPGEWFDFNVAEEIDCGFHLYGVSEKGEQDLYVLCHR